MPKVNPQLPQTPNVEWKDLQFRFDGKWMPDVDPSLIGPENYSTIKNLRYKDSGIEGVNGYSLINTDPLDGTAPYGALGNYPLIRNGHQLRSDYTQKTYILAHSQNSSGQGRVFVNRSDIGTAGAFDTTNRLDVDGHVYYEDSAEDLVGRFSGAPRGNLSYGNGKESMIFGGDKQQVAAIFSSTHEGTSPGYTPVSPIEYTNELSNNIKTDALIFEKDAEDQIILMTTRPIQSIHFSITAIIPGEVGVAYWDGAHWTGLSITDGTNEMANSGSITFDHTKAVAKLKHFEELYLYAYLVYQIDAGATTLVNNITVDTALQNITNVWDGVYRQPVQVQVKNATDEAYADYTAQANVASEEDAPVGMKLTELLSAVNGGQIILMFTEKQAAVRMQMLGSLVNRQILVSPSVVMTVKYWNGTAFAAVTTGIDGTASFSQTGLISWLPPTIGTEYPRTLFDTFGYAYEITLNEDVLPPASSNTYVDIITGIPAQKEVKGYDFPSHYGSRVMQCAPTVLNEGNRIDFSVANAPDVYNGEDSSNNGEYALYFGGSQKITATAGLYNRFGSNILSMFLVLKDAETYLLVGDDPDEFTIYPVSQTIGCPAPLTLATGEINMSKTPTDGITRNIAVWMSASGPVMFDGASISSIRGVDNFFDPNNDEYIEWDVITRARGWIDNVYKEYNLLIPSGTGATENNKWLVYDLLRRKWYEKDPSNALYPQAAWETIDTTGERFAYGGIDSGYMLHLENGVAWASESITQTLKTGDFFPSSQIWDETLIRKFKLLTLDFQDNNETGDLNIKHYSNSSSVGVAVGTIDIQAHTGNDRIINTVFDTNTLAWAHAYEFIIATGITPRGFRPIAWGIRYRVERKDDLAT